MRIGHLVSALAAVGILFAGCATEKQAEAPKPEAKVVAAPEAEAEPAPVVKAPEPPPAVVPDPEAAPIAVPAAEPNLPMPPPGELDMQGFIRNWVILGPFPNPGERPENKGYNIDYLKDNGGEAGHVPADGMEIAGGGFKPEEPVPVKWTAYTSTLTKINFAGMDFLKTSAQTDDILAYAACWVESKTDQDVELRVGSDDGYKLWIDHKHIADMREYRSCERDQETYKVSLKAGKRTLILIKVDQDWGSFEFLMRLVKADGSPAPGIKNSN